LNHQAKKTTSQFFPALYEEYFAKWPPTPSKKDIADGKGVIKVAIAAVRALEEYVRDFGLTTLISRKS
jgi:hypothetical protein